MYLNKSDFPSFGIKFNFPSENVPAPPNPDRILHGLQLVQAILFLFIGQHLVLTLCPLSINKIFKLLSFSINS